jgi:hypothetical protein
MQQVLYQILEAKAAVMVTLKVEQGRFTQSAMVGRRASWG